MKLQYLLLTASFAILLTCIQSKKRLLAWLCLEFCDETPEQIARNMAEIEARKDLFTAISFEKYTLGPNSTLVDNNLTEVSQKLVLMGVEAWPLLSSFPHPPEFIDWMRFVFQNPGEIFLYTLAFNSIYFVLQNHKSYYSNLLLFI